MPFESLRDIFAVFVAGGLGVCSRVALAGVLDETLSQRFAFPGTLLVNLIGCFAIGLLAAIVPTGTLRLALLGGFLGGFTTYSAFALLTLDLAQHGRWTALAGQLGAHVGGGLACVALGSALGALLARGH